MFQPIAPTPLIENKMSPELEIKRLLFYRFENNDAQAVFARCSNPNVSRFTSGYSPKYRRFKKLNKMGKNQILY